MPRRSRYLPGVVVAIDLGDRVSAVGRLLQPPLCEFYDLRMLAPASLHVEDLRVSPVLFRLYVMRSAFSSGRWPSVGELPLTAVEQMREEAFFRQDAINGTFRRDWIDASSGQSRSEPATYDMCIGLERNAVWDATHVEDRLRDHFAGLPNKWLESLRPRPASE